MTAGERITRLLLGALLVAVFALLYAPVVLVALFSAFDVQRNRVDWSSFSLDWYWRLFGNEQILAALTNTLIVGIASVAFALVLASMLAIYYHAATSWLKELLQAAIFLPFLLPPIISGLSLLIFFAELGVSRGLITVAIGHTVFVLALVYRTILNRLQQISRSLLEASADLGANGWQTFRYVLLPQLSTALITSALLAFTLSFDETLITVFLVGDTTTLPIKLWAMMRVGFTPEVNALVVLVLAVSIALTVIVAATLRPAGDDPAR